MARAWPQPGIVGIAEVVKEAYPDSTALDAKSSKHDPKSTPEEPRWYMVDVKLVCTWTCSSDLPRQSS